MSAGAGLLPYQARWVRDDAGLKVIAKSRRIGLSWAEAYDSVLHAAGGGGDVYYQSYSLDMARGFIDDCAWWGETLQRAASDVGEIVIELDDGTKINAFRIELGGGKEIVAMSSAPRGFRSKGRPGDRAVIDEAAFVDDLGAVLKAAMAFRMWGGTVHVISTHHGEGSPFNGLVRDVEDGSRRGSLHTVTFRRALEEGLYRRICRVTGREWSPEAEADWEADLRREYGEAAAEELDCVPSAGMGAWLAWELIRAAEDPEAGIPGRHRGGQVWIGVDVARRRDLWVAAVVERVGDVLWTRELRVERGITFAEQRAIVDELAERYPVARIAVDQTGMGEGLVEQLQERHGTLRVEGVLMTGPRRLDVATALREAVEDRRLRVPAGDDVRRDLHAVRAEAGPTGAPRLVAERGGTDGHADRFWALALAVGAARTGAERYEYRAAGRAPAEGGVDGPDRFDDDDPPAGGWDRYAARAGASLRAAV